MMRMGRYPVRLRCFSFSLMLRLSATTARHTSSTGVSFAAPPAGVRLVSSSMGGVDGPRENCGRRTDQFFTFSYGVER